MDIVIETPQNLNSQTPPELAAAFENLHSASLAFFQNAHLSRPTIEDAQALEECTYQFLWWLLKPSRNLHLRRLALKAVSDALRLASLESASDVFTGNDKPLFGGQS